MILRKRISDVLGVKVNKRFAFFELPKNTVSIITNYGRFFIFLLFMGIAFFISCSNVILYFHFLIINNYEGLYILYIIILRFYLKIGEIDEGERDPPRQSIREHLAKNKNRMSVKFFLFKKSFQIMIIIVDTREHKLMSIMNSRGVKYLKKQMDVGDVCIADGDADAYGDAGKHLCLLERKTVSDLSSSIVDGRYHEQKARLAATGIKVGYIIEGTVDTKDRRVFGAVLNTALRDNIPVLYARNAEETVDILQHYVQKPPDFFKAHDVTKNYTAIHVKKSSNITPRDAYISQLSVIPGVSRAMGAKIQESYPTMRHLVRAMETSDNVFGHIPKIGKVLSQRIVDFLCPDA